MCVGGRGSNQCVFGKHCGFLPSADFSHEKRPKANSCQCYPVSLRKCNRSLAEACASRKCAGVGGGAVLAGAVNVLFICWIMLLFHQRDF